MPRGFQAALDRQGLRHGAAGLAAGVIALTGVLLAPGIDRANQTYPMGLGAMAVGADGNAGSDKPVAPPEDTRYLTRRTIEKIARQGIGKLHGLRIGPFTPAVHLQAMPLRQAEQLLGRPVPRADDSTTPTWLVTVDAPPKADPSGDRTSARVYSEIIDAVSGAVIESCPGCATLHAKSCN